MNKLRFDCPIEGFPGFRVDAVAGDTVFEVIVEAKDARRLRTALIEMARVASTGNVHRVVLLLEEPKISETRLRSEWIGAAAVIRPELLARLSMAIRLSGNWIGIPVPPAQDEIATLEEVLRHELSKRPASVGRGSEAHHEILRILIHQWLLGKGPSAVKSLMKISGTSHPTVARALDRFDHYLTRHSDRSVELRAFPLEDWSRLLAVAHDVRGTVWFTDRSGLARSPESLVRRLRQLQRQDIAVGGVFGAKHYLPSLDIVGNPHLDVSIHSGRKTTDDLSFVERLDPGLERSVRRDKLPTLVVHTIRRAESLFQPGADGLPWADPVECLLDLHEARLEPQALEFFNSFPATKGRSV